MFQKNQMNKTFITLDFFSTNKFTHFVNSNKMRPDVIILISPLALCAVNLFLFRLISLKKIIYHLHIQDFEIDAAFSLGILRGKL